MLGSYYVRCTTWNSNMMKGTLADYVACFLLAMLLYRIAVVATLFPLLFWKLPWPCCSNNSNEMDWIRRGRYRPRFGYRDGRTVRRRYTRSFVLVLVYPVFIYCRELAKRENYQQRCDTITTGMRCHADQPSRLDLFHGAQRFRRTKH